MRIGLFTDSYPPFINGVSTSVAMLKNALEKKGHTVYVVTVNNSSIKYDYNEESHILKIPGVPIGLYDYRLSRIYPLKVINIMKSWDLDVIHSHTELGIGILARIFAKQFNIPLVHTYHTIYEDYTHYVNHGYFEKPSKKIVEHLTKFYCDTTAKEIIVPTNKTYKLLKDKYKIEKNIHIVPTGIEVERFFLENIDMKLLSSLKRKLKKKKKDYVIIFVGRLAKEKNVEFLLESQKKLVQENTNIKLIIVGDGPDKEKYEDIASNLDISDNVIFTGKIPWDEIQYYYHLSNFFVTASKTETQGLTVVEAMASSVVPLVINDEAFDGTVTNQINGLVFESQEEYCKDILLLIRDSNLKNRLSNQARIQSEHLSTSQFAENVLVVYERVIKEKNKYRFGFLSKIYHDLRR